MQSKALLRPLGTRIFAQYHFCEFWLEPKIISDSFPQFRSREWRDWFAMSSLALPKPDLTR
ncbi:hypothetical protein HDF08_001792 [Edaphobacter lichenicola]|uniref:Uncharacterized protein n=1 Tax=Tunturiibacter lichenicola TaxID=2051959 RepID=A0A852VHP7_9BACT|nr:hypothetical protein [Edaphobacter lichenicola]